MRRARSRPRLEHAPSSCGRSLARIARSIRQMKRSAPSAMRDERVGPFGVARIGEHLAAVGQADRGRGRAGSMDHFRGAGREAENSVRRAGIDLDDLPRKSPVDAGGARKEHLQQLRRAARACPAGRRWSAGARGGLRNWASSRRNGSPPKWSPCRWLRRTPSMASGRCLRLQRDQRGRSAIEQHGAAPRLHHEAGVEPAARAERVARSDDGQTHSSLQAFALGRAERRRASA